jgi:putative ABC transport system ATP-binding protein
MLRVRELAKSFSGAAARRLFSGVSFDVSPGEIVAIAGESGSGKSTLLNILAGLERADAGEVWCGEVLVSSLDDAAATRFRRHSVGFVFQAFHLLPHLSCAENVALPLALNGYAAAEQQMRAIAALAGVGLGERASYYPRQLSGGEQQRVAIARALVIRPRLVLADEPTGNLDEKTAAIVLAQLRDSVRAQLACTVLVTHSAAAVAMCDRQLRLTADGLADAMPAGA